MRTFVALDIDDSIRERIQLFIEGVSGFAPDARWVRAESLHVTLKFIGEKPDEVVEQIKQALSTIRAEPITITLRGYGFFPTAHTARVFWIGIDSAPTLPALVKAVDGATFTLGIAKEDHAYTPHLTLARGAGRSGTPHRTRHDDSNKNFLRLQEKMGALPTPEFGTMTAREFFLYQSQLSRGGSRYTKIARFALG